jgi:hypothetical protein
MGALFQNVCYPDALTAKQSLCSGVYSSTLQGADIYSSECATTDFSDVAMTVCKRTNGSTCATVSQPWPTLPDCSFEGGVSLAYDWFLASITFVVIVWGGRKLIQLFDHPTIE